MIDCNWLQSLEVGIDPVHTSFLHRFFEDEDPNKGYGKMFRDTSKDSDMPMTQIMREFPRPRIEVEPTDYGFRLITLRQISDEKAHVRVTNLIFPNAFIIPMSREMTISQWHVPIDDVKHYWYAIFTSFGAPVDKDEMRRQRLELYELPDYVPRKNKSNDYGFDPHEQEHATYTGMGADINVHDQWACESMGAIQDRTAEHLGTSDKAISAYRRLLRQALDQSGKGEQADDGARCRPRRRPSPAPPASTASARPATGRAIGSAPARIGKRPRAGRMRIDGPVIPGRAEGAGPESITPVCDYGFRSPDGAATAPPAHESPELCRTPRSLDRRSGAPRQGGRAGDQEKQARTGAVFVRRSARRAARQDHRGGRRARA